jgi:hypothetical protein
MPARQIKSKCSIAPSASEPFNGKPFGGAHHCIGTGHEIVDAVFRYLQTKCASHGGTLTDSELAEAQIEFVDDFLFMFDQFEDIHARCMDASCSTAPIIFAKGRMLSSLLFTCSRSAAAHVFSSEVQDLRGNRLNAFYVALSDFVLQYISLNAEARLTSAYVKASRKHGQTLTIDKFLQEQTVQNVLRECLRGFETPGFINASLACLNDTLDDNISKDAGFDTPHLHITAIDQMREFLNRLPDEIKITLKQFAPIEMAR